MPQAQICKFPYKIEHHSNPMKILSHKWWSEWIKNGESGLIPDKKMRNHINLAKINRRNYVRLNEISFPLEFPDTIITISGETPWFCLDLIPLIKQGKFQEAEDKKFILCPICGNHKFSHSSENELYYADTCLKCNHQWHAVGYSWTNSLVGEWLFQYGKYLQNVH